MSRHNPLYPKHLKYHNPQLSHDTTMKKKTIQDFPTLFTHTIPIYHYDVTLAKMIQSDNFSKGNSLSEESQPQRTFSLPNALPKVRGVNIRKNLVKDLTP